MLRTVIALALALTLVACFGGKEGPQTPATSSITGPITKNAYESKSGNNCKQFNGIVSNYYKAPNAARVSSIITQADHCAKLFKEKNQWSMVGFFAALFKKHPDRIEDRVKIPRSTNIKRVTTLALVVAGYRDRANQFFESVDVAGKDWGYFDRVPSGIMERGIALESNLFLHWGASYATGDPKYARKILHKLAVYLNRSRIITEDVSVLTDIRRLKKTPKC